MANYYAGHTAGQNDNLFPDNKQIWDWRLSSVQVSKSIGVAQCLPGQPDTTSYGYGTERITDNLPPAETRTYTASCVNRTMLNNLLAYAKTRYKCLTITDRLGFSFSGRVLSVTATENGGDTEASAFYSVSLQLRSLDTEASGTSRDSSQISDT